MASLKIRQETRDRCNVYPVTPSLMEKFSPISLDFYAYLYQVPKVDFSLFFRVEREMIEYMKPSELCHEFLDHIWKASQKKDSDLDVCILRKDRKKFENVINHVRKKKIKSLLEKDSSLDKKTLHVFSDLSGASQMIVRGGIDKNVAEKATAAASYMVNNLMKSESAVGTLSRMITIDPTLYDHSAAVAMFAGLMATRFSKRPVSTREAAIIAQCGLYHDTGKSCVPSAVLNKPGSFTDAEYDIMKTHTHLGCKELE